MLSFHDDISIKEKYLERIRAHVVADEIIKGKYWKDGKGCAVGCTIHGSDHSKYETELGLPEWLAKLEDLIFEGLPNDQAKLFPQQFLEACPVGKDLTSVRSKFCAFLLQENIGRVLSLDIDEELKPEIVSAVRQVLAIHKDAIRSGLWGESNAWYAAKSGVKSGVNSGIWSAVYISFRDELLRLLREAGE